MRVPNAEHAAHPWVITAIAPDFTLLDAWALGPYGAREDFGAFLHAVTSFDPARSASAPTRALFALRFHLGALLGWDDPSKQRPIPGCTETSLSARLPAHLRGTAAPFAAGAAHGFIPLYQTSDEWASEISNATVHGVLQLAWVEERCGRYRGRIGVYVKPRGRLGSAYLAAIQPFRHFVVYPALIRQLDGA